MGGERLRLKDLEKKKSTQSQKKSFTTALRVWYSTGGRILPPRSQASARKEKGWMSIIQQHKRNATVRFWEYIEEGKVLLFQCCAFFKEKVDFGHDPHSKAHCVRAWSGALRCLPETTLPPAPGLIIPSTLRMVSIRSYIIKWGKRGRSGLDFLRKN